MNTLTTKNITHIETHPGKSSSTLNWLRAAVLGANDGIVSTAALIVGVAGASNSSSTILTAGVAGLVAGALSMGVGEYISVSTQRDTEKALIQKEKQELIDVPESELAELVEIYKGKGLSTETATLVAEELTKKDAIRAHLDAELGIDQNDLTNPWHAAFASSAAFLCGAIIPIIMVVIAPANLRLPITFAGVLVALVITGMLSAHKGGANKLKATARVVLGGFLAMLVTFLVGKLFGVVGI